MNPTINIASVRDAELKAANGPRNVHDHLKNMSVDELQEYSRKDRLPWHTACLNVTGDLNVGAMIRTSHCMGASSVMIFGRQKIDNRSLVGSANYINVEKIKDQSDEFSSQRFFWTMRERNLTPIFVEIGGLPLPRVDWKSKLDAISHQGCQPCMVMGNETGGIPQEMIWSCLPIANSFVVSIPQRGVIRSMNVSVAHSMVVGSMCAAMEWM
jgi:tRNA(Leu) C34 or U34 (ribose-2'-O)-methylase TrmL